MHRLSLIAALIVSSAACASTGGPAPAPPTEAVELAPGNGGPASEHDGGSIPEAGTPLAPDHPLHAVCASAYAALGVDSQGFSCAELKRVDGGASPIASAALVRLEAFDTGAVDVRLLAFHDGEAWTRGPVVQDLSISGMGGHDASGTLENLSLRSVDGTPLLIVEGTTKRIDSDMAYNAVTIDDQRDVWICTAAGDAPACAMVPLLIRREVTTLHDDGDTPPDDYERGVTAWERGYSVKPDGTIALRPGDGDLPSGFTAQSPGDYAPADLLDQQQPARTWRPEP